MKKRLISLLVVVGVMIGSMVGMTTNSFAAGNDVSIKLPNFKVTMNGQVVNNNYSKYPLIVYKDVTYFPMTYSDCRILGIESTWKGDKDGLLVDATGVTAAYNPYLSSTKNGRSYTATILQFPIKVNGKAIDNSKEEYPLLSFRNITYFPMSWKYGVNEFGWEYSFDEKNGLVIKSKNKKVEQIKIPTKNILNSFSYDESYDDKGINVLAKNGYVYYVNKKGEVIQAPLNNVNKGKKIFQLGKWSYGDGTQYDNHLFYEENGKPMLFFHSGGAVMGSDHRYLLKEDGTVQMIQDSYYETTLIGDKLYMYFMGPTPGPGNLRMGIVNGLEDSEKSLGTYDYWYYSLTDVEGLANLVCIGTDLYTRAAKYTPPVNSDSNYSLGKTAVCKVNTKTNETTLVSQTNEQVVNSQIVEDYLYYLCHNGDEEQNNENTIVSYSVYKHSLKDCTETKVGEFTDNGSWNKNFAVVGDNIYYVKNEKLYRIGSNDTLNPNAEVISMNITGDKQEYLVCRFKETSASKYRVMVFDKSGKVVFKTSDCGINIVVEGNTLYFYNITTGTICKTTI